MGEVETKRVCFSMMKELMLELCEAINPQVRKRLFLRHLYIYQNDHFTKTGSGHKHRESTQKESDDHSAVDSVWPHNLQARRCWPR
eukprot:COSAG06_NODE_32942_length_497_cov_4.771357_1_plen_85_part_10